MRMVVTAVTALLIGMVSVALATAAQATHAESASPGRYIAKETVLPGQSRWSLAAAYDPNADIRAVIQEIRQQLNSMTGNKVQPGEVPWVPRGLAVGAPGARAACLRHAGAGAASSAAARVFGFDGRLRLPRGAALDYG